ncbi:hypothetical protein AAVH_16335, partial [Aphelenchoides avenae]
NAPYRRSDVSMKQRSASARRPSGNVIVARQLSVTRTEKRAAVPHEKEERSEDEKKENLPSKLKTI